MKWKGIKSQGVFRLMINILGLLCLLISTQALGMNIGECIPKENSKKYIDVDFQAPYPRTVSYSCEYHCKGPHGEEVIIGISKVTIYSMTQEAKGTVCQGVMVKQTSWGYDFDGVKAFYAHDTKIKAIKSWASKNIDRSNKHEVILLSRLKKILVEVGLSYSYVARPGFDHFGRASHRLLSIAEQLPNNTNLLDSELQIIFNKQGHLEQDMMTENGLVESILGAQAAWRFPEIF